MAICLYPQDCEDFSTNGLGVLTPISCTVTEESCGEFELELQHPIDPVISRTIVPDAPGFSLRWAQLDVGCILKVPVPTRESPLYETEGATGGIVSRNVYEVSGVKAKATLPLYSKASGRRKKLAKLKNGERVNEIGETYVKNALWKNVVAQNGGLAGWVPAANLTLVGTVQENVWNGQIVNPKGIAREQCREQLFRIYSVERDGEKGIVTVKAMHISYDLRATLVNGAYKVEEKTPMHEVLQGVFDRLATENEFSLHLVGASAPKVRQIRIRLSDPHGIHSRDHRGGNRGSRGRSGARRTLRADQRTAPRLRLCTDERSAFELPGRDGRRLCCNKQQIFNILE